MDHEGSLRDSEGSHEPVRSAAINGKGGAAPREMTFWERSAQLRWGAYLSRRERQVLETAIVNVEPGAAFEVGCDGGRWCSLLADSGWAVAGCDINPAAIELCRERIPGGEFMIVQSEDTRLPVPDNSLNLLLAIEVPEVTQSEWFPAEAARTLRLDGLCVFCVHNGRSLRGAAYTAACRVGKRRMYRNYYRDSLPEFQSRMEERGFVLSNLEGLAWFPFKRDSNSQLIPVAEKIERLLGLGKLPQVSPFVSGVAVFEPSVPA